MDMQEYVAAEGRWSLGEERSRSKVLSKLKGTAYSLIIFSSVPKWDKT